MIKEFREFIAKGNVLDLAVAVIMGAAFGAIVTSLIEDLITPLILNPVMQAAGVDELANLSFNGIKYGNFLAAVLNFLVIAFVMFLLVRAANRMMEKQAEAPAQAPEPSLEVQLLTEIRDLLKAR
ncbi:MAG: large conductance mechanosensitive channel protein MscL [Caldilineaceae bacterium]